MIVDVDSSPDRKKPNNLKTFVPKIQVYSDESEDLDMNVMTSHDKRGEKLSCNRKRLSSSVRNKSGSKYTENIETFTSSEDEHPSVKKSRRGGPKTDTSKGDFPTERERAAATTGQQTGKPKTVSFTGLKNQTSPTSKGKTGSIDSVLGGVQEVVYTHSNQKVVGGSKAEELISRAAMRDVFERKMFSQLPANHLLGTQEVLSFWYTSPPDSQPLSVAVGLEKPRAEHPVTFSSRSVHHTRHTTFMIGETPQAICRQQLEEMAEKFRFPSADQFAVEILRSNSTQRLTWLREYYTSLNNPELAKTVTNKFPQPDSAQTASTSSAKRSPSTPVPRTTATKSLTESKGMQKRKKKPKHPEEKSESPKNNGEQNSSQITETFQGQKQNAQTPCTSAHHSLLTDLIGDTSILDDLFKPKTKGASKGNRKDFWDILHEGNEESINRLTDPAEVQRVCIKTNIAARTRSGEEGSKNLWKTNEKFLSSCWRKDSTAGIHPPQCQILL
uniref:Uncharacterized protein n=1 Tax=Sphaeramia orbicularis TaxID=375764 RepID=A0A672Z9U6_9TELE